MKLSNSILGYAKMHALGAINDEQLKEFSSTNEEYCMAMYYSHLYEEEYYEYLSICEEVTNAFKNLAKEMERFGYHMIGKSTKDHSYLFVTWMPVYKMYDWDIDVEEVEEAYTPIEMFKVVHNYYPQETEDVELPF